jgi:hypothetical protein
MAQVIMEEKTYFIIVEIPEYNKKYYSEEYDIQEVANFKYNLRQINSIGYVELNVRHYYRPLISDSSQLCITKEMLNKCIITINRIESVD